jgi:hypothetical protein
MNHYENSEYQAKEFLRSIGVLPRGVMGDDAPRGGSARLNFSSGTELW